jgi:hypothetical protein
MNKTIARLAAFGSLLSLGTAAVPAFADTPGNTTNTINILEYAPTNLTLQLATGTNYLATTSAAAGCTAYNVSMDTIKLWQSLAQGALLSGKTVRVYFTQCSANNLRYITTLDLNG